MPNGILLALIVGQINAAYAIACPVCGETHTARPVVWGSPIDARRLRLLRCPVAPLPILARLLFPHEEAEVQP